MVKFHFVSIPYGKGKGLNAWKDDRAFEYQFPMGKVKKKGGNPAKL